MRHKKTQKLIDVAQKILAEHHPMTVRQVYYQLVSRQGIKNNRGRYQAVSDALVAARREGIIPWDWIEDRLRQPRHVSMWDDLADFAEAAIQSYRRDVWATQPRRVEAWLEKDALSGIFQDVLNPYGVTLNVGRGYDGWASIQRAAERFGDGDSVDVLYFGDFDPSGEDMVRSLIFRLACLGSAPTIVKCALTADDIRRYNLPPDPTKSTDNRAAKFIAEHGDNCVELDALPVDVLRRRLEETVRDRMDIEAWEQVRALEQQDHRQLAGVLGGMR
ncbi:MAG TPA: hypothetical protein VIL86_07205 [Tepidisphaeraceae bacterium]|jgi:hypothetical protein